MVLIISLDVDFRSEDPTITSLDKMKAIVSHRSKKKKKRGKKGTEQKIKNEKRKLNKLKGPLSEIHFDTRFLR